MGNRNQQGGFWKGLVPSEMSYFKGYETEIADIRMRFRVRKIGMGILAISEKAQNVSFRTGRIKTGFGYGSLGFTRNAAAIARGFGIIPTTIPYLFYSCYSSAANSFELNNLLTVANTQLNTSHTPVNLVSSAILNGLVCYADGGGLYASSLDSSGNQVGRDKSLVQKPAAPTATANTTTIFSLEGVDGSAGIDRIQKFSSTGTYQTSWGSTGSATNQFSSAQAICTDVSGAIYVLDAVNTRILKYDSFGNYISSIQLPSVFGTYSASSNIHMGIAVDSVGNIWAVSQSQNNLFQFDGSGNLLNQFGSSGASNGQFNTPTGVCADANGNIWVTDTNNKRIQKFNNQGVFISSFNNGGALNTPIGICADNASSVYFADSTNNTIYQVNINTNTLTNSFASHYTGSLPSFISTDNTYLYVFDTGTGGATEQISKYTTGGNFQSSWGALGTGTSQFKFPNGIAAVVTNAAATPAGFLNGVYLYLAVFSDANGNSSGGGTPLQVTMANQQASIVVPTTGFDTGTNNIWTTVSLYRTQGVFTSIPPINLISAQTFYLVGTQTLNGSNSYTFNDNISDLGSQSGITTKAQLVNNNQITITEADYLIGFENRIYAFGVTDNTDALGNIVGSNTYYPWRCRWCDLKNPTSWGRLNFQDFDKSDGQPLIGAWAGTKEIFVFKANKTYGMVPTGQPDTGIPYQYTTISGQYGLFHHTIQDMGGALIGTTKDGLSIFNGIKFSPVSYSLSTFFQKCIVPIANSGAYDFATKKYYLAVCDSTLVGTYGSGSSIQNAWRNTTVVYDAGEGVFEIHPLTFNQVYKTIFDSYGKPTVIAQGVCSEINYIIGETAFAGPVVPFSLQTTVLGLNTLSNNGELDNTTLNCAVGKNVGIAYWADQINSKISFLGFTSYVASVNTGSHEMILNDNVPSSPSFNPNMVGFIDSASGTSQVGTSASNLVDGVVSSFAANGHNGCSMVWNTATISPYLPIYDSILTAGNKGTVSSSTTLGVTSGGINATGNPYLLLPYRYFSNPTFNELAPFEPRRLYLFPPMGLEEENIKKCFRYLEITARGNCTILIRVYLDGAVTSYAQRFTVSFSDRNVIVKKLLDLGGYNGNYVRVEIGVPKDGSQFFDIQKAVVYYRQMGAFRNA